MFNIINKSEHYYKYNLEKESVRYIGDFDDLLLEIFQNLNKGRSYYYEKEHYGGRLNITGNDTYCQYSGIPGTYQSKETYVRPYLFFDGYDRNIDTRNFLDEAIRRYDPFRRQIEKMPSYCENLYKKFPYLYRRSPVAFTSKKKGGPNASAKRRGIHRIHQIASDPEYGKYIRKKAIPKNEWSDEIFEERRQHESWKKQKKRKQWM